MSEPRCTLCPLHREVKYVKIPSVGSVTAKYVFLDDQPLGDGREPFGDARFRRIFLEMLMELGIDVSTEVWLAFAVARCYVGKNRGKTKYAGITTARACKTHLKQELDELKPKIVFTHGQASLRSIFNDNSMTLKNMIGGWYDHPDGYKVMPLESTRELAANRDLWPQLRSCLERAFNPEFFVGKDWGMLELKPSRERISELLEEASRVPRVASDVETTGLDWWSDKFDVTHLGVYWGDGRGCIIDPREDPESYALFQNFRQTVHNSAYEGNVYDPRTVIDRDVYVMAYLDDPNNGLSLQSVSRKYLGTETWKGNERTWEDWALRCARDIRCTYELNELLWERLDPMRRRLHDEVFLPSSIILGSMAGREIIIDQPYQRRLEAKLIQQQRAIKKELEDIFFFWGNPNSSQQSAQFLYKDQGIPIPEKAWSKDGNHSTAKEFLAELAIDYLEAGLIREWRQIAKVLSNYIYDTPTIRPKFRSVGTVTGRPAGEEGIQTFARGYGVRESYLPSRGRFVAGDLSQVELRTAAIFSGDNKLGHIYRTNGDVHTYTCKDIIGELTAENRNRAKPVNFSLVYGGGARMLREIALVQYNVRFTDAEAAGYRGAWFHNYAGIGNWHVENIRQAIQQGGIRSELGQWFPLGRVYSNNQAEVAEAYRHAHNYQNQGAGNILGLLCLIEAAKLDRRAPVLYYHDAVYNDTTEQDAEPFRAAWSDACHRRMDEFWPPEERRNIPLILDTKIQRTVAEEKKK